MSAPEVTVLMTVFNGGRFLAPAMESILCQSWEDFEFVIVDDASTDGSVGVLNQFAANDRRIRLILNKENSGQTAGLNQGLREARGRWIARQDADDLSLPGRLAAQMSHAARFPDLVLVGVNGWVIDEGGKRMGLIHVPLSDAGIRWSMPFQNPFIHPGVIFRRVMPGGNAVAYCEDFRICQDWELWSRIADEGRLANLPERLVCYRDRRDSLSHRFSDDTRRECRAVSAAAWKKNFPGETLSEETALILERFRGGLGPEQFREFLEFYTPLRERWIAAHPSDAGARQADAVHLMQAAGGMMSGGRLAACGAMARAMAAAPLWTLGAIWDRVCVMGKQPSSVSGQ